MKLEDWQKMSSEEQQNYVQKQIGCDCSLLTVDFLNAIENALFIEEQEGFRPESESAVHRDQLRRLAEGCGMIKIGDKYSKAEIIGAPPRFYNLKGKPHKLVGVEADSDIAERWATNMKEHSGENITIIPTQDGYALYREA